MLILNRLSKSGRKLAVALGTFDGLHKGHATLISRMVEDAQDRNLESAVFTFAQHPLSVLRPSAAPAMLADASQKRLIYAGLGVEQLAEAPFTPELAMLQPGEFVHQYLLSVGAALVEVGFNFRFGLNGLGDAEFLQYAGKQFGFEVKVLESVEHEGAAISSSRIRQAVQEADFALAEAMLGRPYALCGDTLDGVFRVQKGSCLPPNGKYEAELVSSCGNQRATVRLQGDAILLPMTCRMDPTEIIFR